MNKTTYLFALVISALLALQFGVACGDDDDSGGSDSDSDSDGDSDSDSDADGIPYCAEQCSSASDCVPSSSSGITDANNWDCDDGHCVYAGCVSDAECEDTFMSSDWGCYDGGSFAAQCVYYCSTPSDCDLGISLYDTDNYECDGGYCNWTGCNSTSECQDAMQNTDYVCGAMAGVPYDMCVLSCSSPSDCATGAGPAYDSDNYECEDSICVYSGCNSDDECQQSNDANWECVD